MGRKKTTIISTFVGIISSLVGIMLTFVLRTYLLKCFNNEYVGLYTLLTQTVGILVGIDGGLSSSVLIKIHKPIAENNIEEIRRNYYLVRVIFYFRSILVLFVGSIIGFLIPRMINTTLNLNFIYICYYTYLVLNALSYCFIFDYFMLGTVQRRFIATSILCITNIVFSILNIICLKYFKNYILYLILTMSNIVVAYFICSLVFRKMYKDYYKKYKFNKSFFSELKELIGMAVHTLSNTVIKHSGPIIMSTVLDLSATGLYSNYQIIINGVNNLALQLSLSVRDPLRNISVSATDDLAEKSVKRMTYLFCVVMGSMCITFCSLADVFVSIFWGKDNLIEGSLTSILMAICTMLALVSNPLIDYYYCKEQHKKDKISPIIEVIINIVLSILLGILIGIDGIILGTIVTYSFRIIYRSTVIKNNVLSKRFLIINLIIFVSVLVVFGLSLLGKQIVFNLMKEYSIKNFIIYGVVILLSSFVIFNIISIWTSESRYFRNYTHELLSKISKKNNQKII